MLKKKIIQNNKKKINISATDFTGKLLTNYF